MTADQTRLNSEPESRRNDPVYGWANANRTRPPHRGWDGRPNSSTEQGINLQDDDGGSEHFTPPSTDFLASSDTFTQPGEWG